MEKTIIKREYQQTKRCRKASGGTSSDIRKKEEILDEFDRVVFESIIDRVLLYNH